MNNKTKASPFLPKMTFGETIIFLLLLSASIAGLVISSAFLPEIIKLFQTGSGGFVQMIMLQIVGPIFVIIIFATVFSLISLLKLLLKVNKRSKEF